MNASDSIADRITMGTVNILRLSEHLQGIVLNDLEDLEAELVIDLQKALAKKATSFTIARLNALLTQTRRTIATAYGGIIADTQKKAEELAAIITRQTVNAVNAGIGADVMSVALTKEQIENIARDATIFGSFPREWWMAQDARLANAFAREMRMGQYRGETIAQLVARVRGTKAMNWKDGIMQASRSQAEALVRTGVMTVAGNTNQAVYEANRDVIKGVQWVSTLDSRTTEICIALDGKRWDFPEVGNDYADYKPIGHNKQFSPPPAHFNCRSVVVPITFSWEELAAAHGNSKKAKAAAEIPRGMRAAMDGQIAASVDFEHWLQLQTKEFQDEVLGPARAQLWRRGQIRLSQLTDIRNNPLTMAQLRALAGPPNAAVLAAEREAFNAAARAAGREQFKAAARLQAAADKAAAEIARAARAEVAKDEAKIAAAVKRAAAREAKKAAAAANRAMQAEVARAQAVGGDVAAAKRAAEVVAKQMEKQVKDAAEAVTAVAQTTSERATILAGRVVNELRDDTGDHTSNLKKLVMDDGSIGYFKSHVGERARLRASITGPYYLREKAAYDIAEVIGMDDLVPVTIVREYKGEIGSIQDGVKNAAIARDTTLSRYNGKKDASRAAAFDYFIGNTDRHAKNWMIENANGGIRLIDNGLSFPRRTVGGDFSNQAILYHAEIGHYEIPTEVHEWLKKWPQIEAILKKARFTDEEIAAAHVRLERLTGFATFDLLPRL